MKILKMYVTRQNGYEHYYCMFDEIPEITYEKIGCDYVGSACDENGNIVFSAFLKKERFGNAFAGRELTLNMKDGTTEKIKDFWFDCGSYKEHGKFIDIGASTLKDLQRCYVYCGYNINANTFQKMLDDYYSREKEYEYYEIEKWVKRQYKWFPIIINGKRLPVMVNENGGFAKTTTKEPVYPQINKLKRIKGKCFEIRLFRYSYNDGNRLVTIEQKMSDVLKGVTENAR